MDWHILDCFLTFELVPVDNHRRSQQSKMDEELSTRQLTLDKDEFVLFREQIDTADPLK